MLADLTAEQRKEVIEAFTQLYAGWVDAWDSATLEEQSIAVCLFLAGVKWAENAPQRHGEHAEPPQQEGAE